MKTPLVSVITVVFNGAGFIEETIQSVLNQSYDNVEYIIIDGGSTDGTVDVIRKYADRISYWGSEPDNGIYAAMNKGVAVANGEWINFMNCGDVFESAHVLKLFKAPLPEADVIYGDAIVRYPTFETTWKISPMTTIWKRLPFCHQAAFVRLEILKTYKFSEEFHLSGDFDFFLRLYKSGKKFQYINKLICRYDFSQGASIRNQILSVKERKTSMLMQGFSFWKASYYAALIAKQSVMMRMKQMAGNNITAWLTRLLRK